MKVGLDFGPRDWWQLADRAEKRGMSVAQFLTGVVRDVLAADQPVTFPEKVRDMVERGMPDAVIAEKLGRQVGYVAKVRREQGLPPNRLRREKWEHVLGRADVLPSLFDGEVA